MNVSEYIDEKGVSPFGRWFGELHAVTAARITRVITRMASGNFADTKSVGGGVLESRIDFGPGYRVYFARDGNTLIILLAGGTKRRQQNDIESAKASWSDYKQRKQKLRWLD